jgi:hypothetical protein
MILNRNYLLPVIGIFLAACLIAAVGMYLHPLSPDSAACHEKCQPFYGGVDRDGDNLLLVIRHEPCIPAACNPCGAWADGLRSVNISITRENGQHVFIEPPVRLYEATVFPAALAGSTNATVEVFATYTGWKNQSCYLKLVDKRV